VGRGGRIQAWVIDVKNVEIKFFLNVKKRKKVNGQNAEKMRLLEHTAKM